MTTADQSCEPIQRHSPAEHTPAQKNCDSAMILKAIMPLPQIAEA